MTTSDIHEFARLGELDALRQAVEAGIDINAKNRNGASALQCAIAHRQVAAVELLLELGADVSVQDKNGSTALHYAIEFKLPGVLEALLRKFPEAIAISDKYGNQPLWTAAFNARGNYAMVSMLLRYGANPNHLNNMNLSPLDIPKRKVEPALLHLLEEKLSSKP